MQNHLDMFGNVEVANFVAIFVRVLQKGDSSHLITCGLERNFSWEVKCKIYMKF